MQSGAEDVHRPVVQTIQSIKRGPCSTVAEIGWMMIMICFGVLKYLKTLLQFDIRWIKKNYYALKALITKFYIDFYFQLFHFKSYNTELLRNVVECSRPDNPWEETIFGFLFIKKFFYVVPGLLTDDDNCFYTSQNIANAFGNFLSSTFFSSI